MGIWELAGYSSRFAGPPLMDTLENPEPCVRRKSVPGSKFAAFWRIFVPGSNLPLREIPTRCPHFMPIVARERTP